MSNIEQEVLIEHDHKLRFTKYVNILRARSDKSQLEVFSKFRNMPMEILEEIGMFYIGSMTEMLVPEFIDSLVEFGVISTSNNKPIFNNRWVIPIKDTDGLVQNLVGYSNKADERYIYGTGKYYRRRDTLYGLENMELAYKLGYSILVEGITDAIRLQSLGYKNTFAMCGTHKSEFIMQQLNRPRYGTIRIPDRDKPGKSTEKHWITNRYITLRTPIQFKDSDELLRNEDNVEWFNIYMKACIDYITSSEHNGMIHPAKEYTMI